MMGRKYPPHFGKGNKYKNKICYCNGIKFQSQDEMKRYVELRLLENMRMIKDLELQKKYEIIPPQRGEKAANYIADFAYTDVDTGEYIVEDVKGMKTREYILKRKLMLFVHGIRIKEITKAGGLK
jgi:hypothetical protein